MRHPGFAAAHRHERLPTRPLWVGPGALYALLLCAFGWGVWQSAGQSRALRTVGVSFILNGLLSPYWPPMHLRGAEFGLTDALHIVWSIATVLLMTVAIAVGATALLPTPWIGVWERISIAAFLAWVAALAIKLLPSPA
jgi:hypothetical protein